MKFFDDIRAFAKKTFRYHWKKLLSDPQFTTIVEKLIAEIRSKKDPTKEKKFKWSQFIPLRFRNPKNTGKHWLKNVKWVRSFVSFRMLMQYAIGKLIEHTTKGLSYSGHTQAFFRSKRVGVCFLSSHRSTALDSALTNYILHHEFGRSTYNAAGDNIFATPWLGRLIRLNKGFIVKRKISDPDEKIVEAEKLSNYINMLLRKREWVWIAHRNGRSKDGLDQSDSAVLSMLKMGSSIEEWGDFSREFYFIPISMSWELIPMDLEIARELSSELPLNDPGRDARNILGEITQLKGKIHIHFSHPIRSDKRSGLLKKLDHSIHSGLRLWESNLLAWTRSNSPTSEQLALIEANYDLSKANWILDRGKELSEKAQTYFYGMYAGPVLNGIQEFGGLENLIAYQKTIFKI